MALTPKKKKISGTKKKDKIVWQNKKPWKSALTVNANSGNDSIDFRKSNYAKNKLNGQNGNDTIRGGKKADSINGGAGSDKLFGYAGNDTLIGGTGNDQFTGGKGNDEIRTGSGTNTVIIHKGDGNDTIYNQGKTYIKMADYNKKDKVSFSKSGQDLKITYAHVKTAKDKKQVKEIITVKNYFTKAGTLAKDTLYIQNAEGNTKRQKISTLLNSRGLTMSLQYEGTMQGTPYRDTMTGSFGNDNIKGGNGNDNINGNGGNDTIDGGNGNDTIIGGAGNDNINGGAGNDSIAPGGGTNTVNSGDGNDIINISDGTNTINAGADNDKIYVKGGTNTINAGAGNNELHFDSSGYFTTFQNTIKNGGGNDTIFFDDQTNFDNVAAEYDGTNLKVYGGNSNNIVLENYKNGHSVKYVSIKGVTKAITDLPVEITGTSADEIFQCFKNNNIINIAKGDGHDKIENAASSTSVLLKLGTGIKNVFAYQSGADYIIERHYTAASGEEIEKTTFKNFNYATSNEKITLNFNGENKALSTVHLEGYDPETTRIASLDGNGDFSTTEEDTSYVVYGDERPNHISTNNGNDIVDAGEGNNEISITGGNNRVTSGSGDDEINIGGAGRNVVNAGSGNNNVTVAGHDNEISTGDGTDVISVTGVGDNTIATGNGNKTINVSNAEAGSTTVTTGDGADEITVNSAGNNNISAGAGANVITVTNGSNTITAGNDGNTFTLNSSAESSENSVTSGTGADTFNVQKGTNTITTGGGADNLDISGGTNTIDMTGTTGGSVSITGGTSTITNASYTNTYNLNGGTTNIDIVSTPEADNVNASVTITNGTHTVSTKNGNDNFTISGGTHNNISTGDGVDNVSITGGSNNVDLGSGADVITVGSSAGASTIIGGKGADAITVNSSENSEIWGGNTIAGANGDTDSGVNTINVQVGGSHTIHGGSWANNDHLGDTINAGKSHEGYFTITGGAENDSIVAQAANSATIDGGAGNDYIYGGYNGNNSLTGGDGNDDIHAPGTNNIIDGGAGDDAIEAYNANNVIHGGRGNDDINASGNFSGRTIYGDEGEDYLFVRGTNNTLYGGTDELGTDADANTVTLGNTYNNRIFILAGGNNKIYAGTGVETEEVIGDDTIKYYKGDSIRAGESDTIYGAAGRDSIFIKGEANKVDGRDGNDYISSYDTVSVTNSTINGGAGNDEINIKGTYNTVAGDGGDDRITVTGGSNSVGSDYGADIITVYSEAGENNTIYGGTNSDGNDDAANTIYVQNKGNNTVYAGNGNSVTGKGDSIYAGTQSGDVYYGNNTIYGGSRNDYIQAYYAASVSIEGGNGNDTIYGSYNGHNTLKGGNDNDSIYTHGSNSLVDGGDGNDVIISDTVYGDTVSHSNITIRGGEGDDAIAITSKNRELLVFKKGDGNDTVEFRHYDTAPSGYDTIRFEDSNLDELYAQIDSGNLVITYNKGATTPDSVTISNFVNAYNNSRNQITTIQYKNGGGYGTISIDDFINTRSIIEVPTTQNTYYGSQFNETITGGDNEGTYYIYGYGGNDLIDGGAGNDKIWGGNNSNDSSGNDTLYGGTGHDTLNGEDGDDKLYADALVDSLSGNTSLSGGTNNSSNLFGDAGNDSLYGGSGNDSLYGGAGNDKLYAKYGNNLLYGGAGDDELYSGSGNDRFNFGADSTEGTDTIFSGEGNDTIMVGTTFKDDTKSNATEKNYSKSGNDLVIATYRNNLGEAISKIIVKDFFPNANVSAKYVEYSNDETRSLSDMKIYQKADGETVTGLNKFNDFLEGSDAADTFNNVGGGTHTDSYNDLVVGGAGDDTINIANTVGDTISYAKIRIANGDGTDRIVNAQNSTKVIIQFKDEANHIDGYQEGDDYIIERRHAVAGEWVVEKTVLQGFTYNDTTKTKIEIYNGIDSSVAHQLSEFHLADYDGTKTLARTYEGAFTTEAEDTVSYYVLGTSYRDTITTGAGDDIIKSFDDGDVINAGNGNNTIITTGSYNKTITAGTGNDTITADRANISIAGGSNTVTTGDDNDTIIINGSGTNVVDLGAGADNLTIEGGNNTVTSANTYGTENITIGGEGTNTVTATAGGDENISITGGANTITTGSSNDTIVSGGTTSNTITTAGYQNRITVSGANATVNVNNSNGQNTISLTSTGTNIVNTTGHSNTITTTQGDNTITLKSIDGYTDPRANEITVGGSGTNTVTIEGDGNTNAINMNSTGTSTITGSAGSDTINVSAGTNTVNATAGADTISITGGTNTINMENAISAYVTVKTNASTNTINGNDKYNRYDIQAGTNTLNLALGENNHDYVTISGGTNTVNGSAGADSIATVSGGTNTFDLGAGDDAIDIKDTSTNTIYGGLGADNIDALYGSNTIYGGESPTVVGGASNDDASNEIDIGGTSAVVYAGDGVWTTRQIWNSLISDYEEENYHRGDSITSARDLTEGTIYGGAGDDTIYMKNNDVASININGGAGNDSIDGSNTGNSTIHGGADNDTISIYTGNNNLVYGDAGDDKIIVGNNNEFNGTKSATIYGGTGNDSITLANTFKETLVFNAGDGNDVILDTWNKNAQDTLIFNGMTYEGLIVNYDDNNNYSLTITYNGGNDSVKLNYLPTGSNYTINSSIATIIATGDPSYNPEEPAGITLTELLNTRSIYTLSPQDTQTGASFSGIAYNEHITGTALNDAIWGLGGNDTIYGGAGNDSLYGDGGSDTVTGNDYIDGGAGNDTINGNAGNDTLLGGADNDEIRDSEGYNTIYGGTGNDTIYATIDDTTTGHNTIGFATGDGTDEIQYYGGENHATLKFDNVNSYDDLHISYETENGWHYYLVIQYGENATDKVRLYDYKFDEDHDVGVKINGQEEIALNTLLVNKHIIVPENTSSNGPIVGSENNDYIYATAYQPTITGGAGNDTIESVGTLQQEGNLNNPSFVEYKFNKDGDGHDVILNARHRIESSKIIFTGFTHEQLDDDAYLDEFFESLVCTKTNDGDLVITYGTDSSITIKGYCSNPMIKCAFDEIKVEHEKTDDDDNYEIYRLEYFQNIQIQKQMANDTPFYGDNQAPEYITGTAGNDTVTVGASTGINVFTPLAGQDTVIFDNRYTDETIDGGVISGTEIIADGKLHKTCINMGTADSPDTLWFKNINSIDNLKLSYEGDTLQIRYWNTGELGITEYSVDLRNFLTTGTPGFTKIKLGVGDNEGAATVTTIQEIGTAKGFSYTVDNRATKATTINTSVLDDYIMAANATTEVIHTYDGNDNINHEGSDTIDPEADTVYAGAGNDQITYNNNYGNDGIELYGEDGNDRIVALSGKIYGGAGSDDISIYDASGYYNETGTYRNVTIYGGTETGEGESSEDSDTISTDQSHGNNEIHGGIGADSIYSGYGNDTIYGGDGNDTIKGYYGNDSIYGGTGADSILGGNGDDWIDGGAGNDTIYGGVNGDNTIYGGDGADLIYREGEFEPYHWGSSYSDFTVHGGTGNDTIWADGSKNEIWGDAGNDEINVHYTSNTVYHFKSGDGHDLIRSSNKEEGDDIIVFDDIAFDGTNIKAEMDFANNLLTIKYDYNEVSGEWDSSITLENYIFEDSGPGDYHSIKEDFPNQSAGRRSSIEYLYDKNGNKIPLKALVKTDAQVGVSDDNHYTFFSDNITFTNFAGAKNGGEGDDTLIGSSGNDYIYGDYSYRDSIVGNDYIDGKEGKNALYGQDGNDTLVGGYDGNTDTLYGGSGDNTFIIKSGVDDDSIIAAIYSNSANDILEFENTKGVGFFTFTKAGADLRISYQKTNDGYAKVVIKDYFLNPHNYKVKYTGGEAYLHDMFRTGNFNGVSKVTGSSQTASTNTTKIGSSGADTIIGYSGSSNTLIGGAGDDRFNGSGSDDVIHGGDGNDTITNAKGTAFGGNGNDTISISGSNTTVYGGAGDDSITGSTSADLIFTGEKPHGDDSISYTQKVFVEGYLDEPDAMGVAAESSTVDARGGNDTICSFGENVYTLNGREGDDEYHTLLTNNVDIVDLYGTNTLQLHSIGKAERAYIVMNTDTEGSLDATYGYGLFVVNEENYNDWLANNGSFSSGHGGVKLVTETSIATITDSCGYSTTSDDIVNTLQAEITGWLSENGIADVTEALESETYRDTMIAKFNTFNCNDTLNGGIWS